MKRFEYKVLTHDLYVGTFHVEFLGEQIQSEMNELGAEGWELVSSTPLAQGEHYTWKILCVYKREIEQ